MDTHRPLREVFAFLFQTGPGPRLIRFLSMIALCMATSLVACQRGETPSPEVDVADALIEAISARSSDATRTNRMLELVESLQDSASYGDVTQRFDEILGEMRRATRADLPDVRKAFQRLRRQPEIVAVVTDRYEALATDTLDLRTAMIAFLGELQRPESFSFLNEIVSSPLPPSPDRSVHYLSRRDLWKILHAKAVDGIAFIRGTDGNLVQEHEQALFQVMLTHPSRFVRARAINAYMWNRGDSPEAAARLYQVLPEEYHQFVERARFARGTNLEAFSARLAAWRERYGNRRPEGSER